MPAVGNHMITEAFRGRRETCRALRRATLRDRNVSSSRMLEQRPGGGGVFGMSSMTAKRSSENAWTPSAAASAPAMARPPRLPRRRCRSRSGRPIVPPSSHAQWMACGAWRHSRGAEPGHLGGLDGGHEDGRLGWCRNVKTRRWRSRVTGLAPTGLGAIASIARGIMVRWPLVQAGYVVDLIPSG
jgi:hypothetical protein